MSVLKKLCKVGVVFFLFFGFSLFIDSDIKGESSFIINRTSKPKKIRSKNRLKEELGLAMKSTIDECAFIVASVGDLLEIAGRRANCKKEDSLVVVKNRLNELASINETVGRPLKELGIIQQSLSSKVEDLVDNRRPFKHANVGALQKALDSINDLLSQLKNKGQALRQLKLRLGENVDICECKVAQNFQQQLSDLNSLRLKLVQNDCFK